MARFSRLEVLNAMVDIGLIPVFYHRDAEVAKKIVSACAAGGARVVEFTNRGDLAYQVFAELVRHFVVGPILNPDVARVCNRRKVAYSPGCGSASEISAAEELGVEICKVFPGAQVGGPAFVKAVLGPCPWTRIMPTGGVDATEESITAWFKAGVSCVGIGSKLISRDLVESGNFEAITRKVADVIAWIKQARAT
jgi:2-dehydro-3-deoxyphosphogluconate aldolase/(4S)-4-hydroxy-2-oxoglutarate aldolase